ncbi:hypothetical protein [Nocardia asteroides]|uniref:hypothetical protein n=1 Tax=Nocardia asteroides TaxID=1824 RepID=UPI003650EBD7
MRRQLARQRAWGLAGMLVRRESAGTRTGLAWMLRWSTGTTRSARTMGTAEATGDTGSTMWAGATEPTGSIHPAAAIRSAETTGDAGPAGTTSCAGTAGTTSCAGTAGTTSCAWTAGTTGRAEPAGTTDRARTARPRTRSELARQLNARQLSRAAGRWLRTTVGTFAVRRTGLFGEPPGTARIYTPLTRRSPGTRIAPRTTRRQRPPLGQAGARCGDMSFVFPARHPTLPRCGRRRTLWRSVATVVVVVPMSGIIVAHHASCTRRNPRIPPVR